MKKIAALAALLALTSCAGLAPTITAQKEKTIPLPPILGGLALAGGIVLVVAAAAKSRS